MIAVRLREAMERYRRRTGRRMTYRQLAGVTGVSESTLQSIAARHHYNTTLDTVDRISVALDCPLAELLEQMPDLNVQASTGPSPDTREAGHGHQD